MFVTRLILQDITIYITSCYIYIFCPCRKCLTKNYICCHFVLLYQNIVRLIILILIMYKLLQVLNNTTYVQYLYSYILFRNLTNFKIVHDSYTFCEIKNGFKNFLVFFSVYILPPKSICEDIFWHQTICSK